MTSAAALKSASYALKLFLEGKPVDYTFTVDSLREDFMTDPTTTMTLSRGAVSGFISKAYARKAFSRVRLAGHVRQYKLEDSGLIFAKNRRSRGSDPGKLVKPHRMQPDSGPPMPVPTPLLPGLGTVPVMKVPLVNIPGRSIKDRLQNTQKIEVPEDVAKLLTRDTMLGAIREIVDAHLEAFEANRPAAEFPDEVACAAKHGAALLEYIHIDALLAEIKKRTSHG